MSDFRKLSENEDTPVYLTKLRTYFNQISGQMIRNHKSRRNSEKGYWITTVLPSLVDRQIRMSSGNLNAGSSMIEFEFVPISSSPFKNSELISYLNENDVEKTLPIVVINSVKQIDNAYLIIVGENADQNVYALGDY